VPNSQPIKYLVDETIWSVPLYIVSKKVYPGIYHPPPLHHINLCYPRIANKQLHLNEINYLPQAGTLLIPTKGWETFFLSERGFMGGQKSIRTLQGWLHLYTTKFKIQQIYLYFMVNQYTFKLSVFPGCDIKQINVIRVFTLFRVMAWIFYWKGKSWTQKLVWYRSLEKVTLSSTHQMT